MRHELRKSVKPQQADDNRDVYVVRIYIPYYYIEFVLAWANCVVYPVWFGQCEGQCLQDGQKNRHLRLFCVSKPNLKQTVMIAEVGV